MIRYVQSFLKKYLLYILPILGIFLCLFLYGKSINISNTKIYDKYNNLRSYDFNDFFSKTKDLYVYKFDLNLAFDNNRTLVIYPNDCITKLEINGGQYYFEPKQDLCYSEEGIKLDLLKYTHIGKNFINIYTQQRGHNRVMTVGVDGRDSMQFLFFTIIIVLFWIIIGNIIRSSKFPRSYRIVFILLFGVILGLSYTYFIESSHLKWTNDVLGHIDYIRIVAYGDLIPTADRCRVCYHPPLYYRFSALIYKVSYYLQIVNIYSIIRIVGVFLYMVSLWFGIKFLYLAFDKKPIAFWLSSLLLLFWPLNFYFGPRIINDNFFYFFSFIFIYLMLFWYKKGINIFEDNKSIVVRSFIILFMGLFSKSNFVIRLPLLFVNLYKTFSIWDDDGIWLFKKSLINNIKKGYKYYLISAIIILSYLGFQSVFKSPELVANVSIFGLIGSISHVDPFQTFTSFDYYNFINNLKRRHDIATDESSYFWNYLFKSMLYSENSVYDKFKAFIGVRMNFIFFIFLISILIKFLFSDKRKIFYIVGFGAPIVAMIIYRIKYPYIATMHYRYILPHILFFLYYLCSDFDVEGFKKIKIVNYISLILIIIFIVFCVLFSLPPYY